MSDYDNVLNKLREKYNKETLRCSELANELGISSRTVSTYLAEGKNLPDYLEIGDGPKPIKVFPLVKVAKFLTTKLVKVF